MAVRRLRTPSASLLLRAALVWTALDVLLHVAVDELDPLRLGGNAVVVAAVLVARTASSRLLRACACWSAVVVVLCLNGLWFLLNGVAPAAAVLVAGAVGLLAWAALLLPATTTPAGAPAGGTRWWQRPRVAVVGTAAVTLAVCGVLVLVVLSSVTSRQLYGGQLVAADYFTAEPKILSAGLGFDGIIGLPELTEQAVRAAGGAWAADLDCAPDTEITPAQRTSAALTEGIDKGFVVQDGAVIEAGDGLPVVFSWPVVSDTIDPRQFRLTMASGAVVYPQGAGLLPNFELNERQTVVLFGELGDREDEFPVRLDIEQTEQELMLAGPDGDVSATGLSVEQDTSGYDSGPTLVAAKLTRVDPDATGEGGVLGAGGPIMPNDETALYGEDADFRLRLLTTGGFTPDGVRALRPSGYADHFRLRATGPGGSVVELTETGVDDEVAGGTVRVLGLSDLGRSLEDTPDDDCYQEDGDNQIDVVLSGDEQAVRSITHVEMPEGYQPLYNPGGPGPDPFEGVIYSAPSPVLLLDVTQALDDSMQVTRD